MLGSGTLTPCEYFCSRGNVALDDRTGIKQNNMPHHRSLSLLRQRYESRIRKLCTQYNHSHLNTRNTKMHILANCSQALQPRGVSHASDPLSPQVQGTTTRTLILFVCCGVLPMTRVNLLHGGPRADMTRIVHSLTIRVGRVRSEVSKTKPGTYKRAPWYNGSSPRCSPFTIEPRRRAPARTFLTLPLPFMAITTRPT